MGVLRPAGIGRGPDVHVGLASQVRSPELSRAPSGTGTSARGDHYAADARTYLSDGGEIALTFADDRTSTAKSAELGIEPRTFEGLPVDAFEVIDHGPEVPLTVECTPR